MRKSFLALALFASVYFVAVRAPWSSEVVPVSRLSVAMTGVSHKQMSVFLATLIAGTIETSTSEGIAVASPSV